MITGSDETTTGSDGTTTGSDVRRDGPDVGTGSEGMSVVGSSQGNSTLLESTLFRIGISVGAAGFFLSLAVVVAIMCCVACIHSSRSKSKELSLVLRSE